MKTILLAWLCLALAACGGGGGEDEVCYIEGVQHRHEDCEVKLVFPPPCTVQPDGSCR